MPVDKKQTKRAWYDEQTHAMHTKQAFSSKHKRRIIRFLRHFACENILLIINHYKQKLMNAVIYTCPHTDTQTRARLIYIFNNAN